MSAWTEVDEWAAKHAIRLVRLEERGELRAFCLVAVGGTHLRLSCRTQGTKIHVEREFYSVTLDANLRVIQSGKRWRPAWQASVKHFSAAARSRGLAGGLATLVLVERDRWLDMGCPRRPDIALPCIAMATEATP